jgi:MSHA biogenesis protein MshQ
VDYFAESKTCLGSPERLGAFGRNARASRCLTRRRPAATAAAPCLWALVFGLVWGGEVCAFDLLEPGGSAWFTEIDSQSNDSRWAAANLLDDEEDTAWRSSSRENDLIVGFDEALGARCVSRFTLENYNGSRSVAEFMLLHTMDPGLRNATGAAGWIPLVADPNPTGPVNHLHWGQGGRLLAVDAQSNDSNWAARNLHNGSLGDYWRSNKNNNTLEFAFDTDWDGTTGDAVSVQGVALSNYGGSRSIERFQVEYSRDGASWQKLERPGSSAGDPNFNFALSTEGGRLDLVDGEINDPNWPMANIHDGSSNSIWRSVRQNNRLDFAFDPDGDGISGLEGDADDAFTLEKISLENYGSERSLREFQVFVRTLTDPEWRALPVPGTGLGEPDYNFALSHNGGKLSLIDGQSNDSNWAAANLHDGATQSMWRSNQANSTLEFVFDTNGDSIAGGATDQFKLERLTLENYGGLRSIRAFQIEVQTLAHPDWRKLVVPGSQAGDAGFNFLLSHEGGRLTRVEDELNSGPDAGANVHDGSHQSHWRSNRPDNTLEFDFDTDLDGASGDPVNVDSFRLENHGGSRSVQTFELDVRIGSGPWQSVASPGGGTVFTAGADSAAQTWAIGPFSDVTAFRLRTLSNHGSSYTAIREIALLGRASGPSRTFVAGPDPTEQTFAIEPATGIEGVTAVRLRTINNYGSSYTGARELRLLGTSSLRPTVFEAAQDSDRQQFVLDPEDRPANVTAIRLKTISNYGSSYVGVRELEFLGPAVAPSHTFEADITSERQVFMLDQEDRVDDVIGVRLLTLDNHGSTYIGAREFEVLGEPVGPSFLFKAAQESGQQSWDFDAVTARLFRLHTTNNYGSSYTGAREIGLESVNACGPLGVWHMDEANWGAVRDSSGNGIDGVAANEADTGYDDPVFPDSPGTCRYGVFDGEDDYVALPTLPDLSESFSIMAWIRPTDLGNDQRIFADDRSNSGGFAFSLGDGGDGRLRFFSRRVRPVILDSPPVVGLDEWRFVAVVHDAAAKSRRIYIDGDSLVAQDSYSGTWGTDSGVASIGGEVDGTSEGRPRWRFRGGLDEVRVYTRALSGAELAAVRDLTRPCDVTEDIDAPAFAFNCVQPGDDALTGSLYTKVVGVPFDLDVHALRDADADNVADAIETDYAQAGNRTVEMVLVDASGGAACDELPTLQAGAAYPLEFTTDDAGSKRVAGITVDQAYRRLRCRITDANDPDPVTACSSDSFAVRPLALALSPPIANGGQPNDALLAAAGAPFTLSATGGPGYDGAPLVDSGKVVAHAGALRVGSLAGVFPTADPATGTTTATDGFRYHEVGSFRLAAQGLYDDSFAAVDIANGDCTDDFSNALVGGRYGCKVGNSADTDWVGRFHPADFSVAVENDGALAEGCGSFSYQGQPISLSGDVVFRVTAKASDGTTTTQNYTGDYAKLGPASFAFSAVGSTVGADGSTPVTSSWTTAGSRALTDLGAATPALGGQHDIALSGAGFVWGAEPPAPRLGNDLVGPFTTQLELSLASVTDADGISAAGPLPIARPMGVDMRYGRLAVANAHGSELQHLPVPIRAEYFAGPDSGFVPSAGDACSTLAGVAIADLNGADGLVPTETCVWDDDNDSTLGCSGAEPAGMEYEPELTGGIANFFLKAPGPGNTGVLGIQATAPDYLKFDWLGTGDTDPSARATFGIFNRATSVIYQREVR